MRNPKLLYHVRYLSTITVREDGEQLGTSSLAVVHEFIQFSQFALITDALWSNEKERRELVEAFVRSVCRNACAALNARCNMTIHFGVDNGGHIRGIGFQSYLLVGTTMMS